MTPRRPSFAFKGSQRLFLVGPDIPERGFPEKRDFSWTKPGEVLGVGGWSCSNPECGCDRSFVGLKTRLATTIGMVVSRDASEVTAHYESAGRAWPGMEGVAAEERRAADQLVDMLTIRSFPVGTLVRIQWVESRLGSRRFILSEVKRMPKSPPPRRRNPDGFWTKGPRPNPSSAHDLVDIVSARTGEVLESRLFRYVAEQNAWLFRHDGNKVRIQKHRPAGKGPRVSRRTNPSHGLTPHYEPEVFPRARFYDDVEIPKGFIAQHYGNDAAPKWIHPGKRLVLWIDAKRKSDREMDGRRFVLGVTDQDFEADLEPILETDSLREVLWTISNHRPGV